MEYVQDRIATCHDYGGADPPAPVGQATVVVPLAERDHGSPAAAGVFEHLAAVDPGEVLVALRASPDGVGAVASWLESFDLDLTVLWCTAPELEARLDEDGLDGEAGKGRDVWLALGAASESRYVVVHDADATSYDETHVPKLLFPLARGYDFSKGYYARVENDRLYGRLFRLFYAPLIGALATEHDEQFLDYLGAFRYALAGEFAMTGELARNVRVPRGWGLELGTLGDAFAHAGFEGTAQVDLGVHEHEHRSVEGSGGLGEMCREVSETLFHVLEEHGVEPSYPALADRYETAADRLVDQYAEDAGFNGFEYDPVAEREQIETYADAIVSPSTDTRLPAWSEIGLDPDEVASIAAADLDAHRSI
jgi:glucosyl-3-phosphoglycerate synthase